MNIRFKKLRETAMLPERATPASAGADLRACLDAPVELLPGETRLIPLGFSAQPSETDVALLIYPRSGLSAKHGIILANTIGVVDSDYRGEWMVPLRNTSTVPFTVKHGMRVAQLVVTPVLFPEMVEADELDETDRGKGGFGSSGLE